MSKEVEVTKIVVAMGGKESTMTIEQAKKLYVQLKELFGEPQVTVVTEHIHHRDRYIPWYQAPYTYHVDNVPQWKRSDITCDGNTAMLAVN